MAHAQIQADISMQQPYVDWTNSRPGNVACSTSQSLLQNQEGSLGLLDASHVFRPEKALLGGWINA